MTSDRFAYHRIQPGNYGILKGFILALAIHGVLFFVGGKLFVKPVQYSVQSATGGVDVDLVTDVPHTDTEAVESATSVMEQQQKTVKLPQPEVTVEKPIAPSTEQQVAVKSMPPEEQAIEPRSDINMKPSMSTMEQQETVRIVPQEEQMTPLPQTEGTVESHTPVTGKLRETVKTVPRPSQGTAETKSIPGYFQNQPPEYPLRAKQLHQEGLVILGVEIDQKGMPVKIEVQQSSGYQMLDQAALKAVRRWRFQPERIGDMPVASKVSIPIRFRLEESDRR